MPSSLLRRKGVDACQEDADRSEHRLKRSLGVFNLTALGIGAVIGLQQSFINPREDARVGLAGPIWGCAAALACAAVYAFTDHPLWGALARVVASRPRMIPWRPMRPGPCLAGV